MVQEIEHSATALRVADYLRTSALAPTLVAEWTPEIGAAGGGLSQQLRVAQQRRDTWLRETLGFSADDAQSLWVAQAILPVAPPLPEGEHCCLHTTPATAPLDMPEQTIALRSVGHYVDRACKTCRPTGRRWGARFYRWLRSI